MPAIHNGVLPASEAATKRAARPYKLCTAAGDDGVADVADNTAAQMERAPHGELIARMIARDETALGEIYDATAGRVYALALRITGQSQAAEEVVSDVYFQIWQQAQRYDPVRGTVLTWMLTICRSRALDSLRRREPAETHAEPHDLQPDLFFEDRGPLDLLLIVEQNSRLHRALATLNKGQQMLLALAFFKGMTHQEIAVHTGMPLGSVKTGLRKAVQLLKSLLQDPILDAEYGL